MAKSLLFLFLLLCAASLCPAQNTQGELSVYEEEDLSTAAVITAIRESRPDSNQVNLMNKLAHLYWHKKTLSNEGLDSCLSVAKQAYTISRKIGFLNGGNEAVFMMCRVMVEQKDVTEALRLTRQVHGELLARLLLTIAEPYVFNFHAGDKELLKAIPLIKRAREVSAKAHSLKWLNESSILLAKLHFKQGNIAGGKQDLMGIINRYHLLKDYLLEAKYWSTLGTYMPENNTTFPELIYSHSMAVKYYLLADNKKEAAYSLRDLAVIRTNHNQTGLAERDLMEMLRLFRLVHDPITEETYAILSGHYRFTGKYDKALYYGLEGIKAAGDNIDKKIRPSDALGATYILLKDYPNALKYYQYALDYSVQRNKPFMFIAAYRIATVQAASGNPKKALTFLTEFLSSHPTSSVNYQQLFASTYGSIHNLLGNYRLAEKYYLKMLSLETHADRENGESLGAHFTLAGGAAYYLAGKFYAERKDFAAAKQHLLRSLQNPQYFDKNQEVDTYRLLYNAEYALGNFRSAVRYLAKNKALSDSLNSAARLNQIAELNIKYESEQKAKEIKLLEKNQGLQQLAIKRSYIIRNVTLFAAMLFMLLAASAYLGYRIKQRSNQQLKRQQDEISDQNTTLQALLSEKEEFLVEKDSLLDEKDGLLKDKDWLLKEVHHRVKNNLQIIMSLLRTQLSHLKNEEARDAIIETEGRVQAISLIHQKLYTTNKLASVNMQSYVADLVHYLSNGLNTRDKHVRFSECIDLIHVDLAQAVPIGLILNEAITNAIKYGGNTAGVDISITFRRVEGTTTLLTISDKGGGLPADFDLISAKSLGMQMMKGLTRQLQGNFTINSAAGVTVSLQFKTTN